MCLNTTVQVLLLYGVLHRDSGGSVSSEVIPKVDGALHWLPPPTTDSTVIQFLGCNFLLKHHFLLPSSGKTLAFPEPTRALNGSSRSQKHAVGLLHTATPPCLPRGRGGCGGFPLPPLVLSRVLWVGHCRGPRTFFFPECGWACPPVTCFGHIPGSGATYPGNLSYQGQIILNPEEAKLDLSE